MANETNLTTFIVRGPYCWGADKSLRAALKKCLSNFSRSTGGDKPRFKVIMTSDDWNISEIDGGVSAKTIQHICWVNKSGTVLED